MKLNAILWAALLVFGLSACDQPEQQQEPEQQQPAEEQATTPDAGMEPAPVEESMEAEPMEGEPMEGETAAEGMDETAEEGDAAEEPPVE